MINLSTTSDLLRLTTDSAANIDVQSNWVDLSGTTVTPGRTNTLISSSTTTTIVASPAASTVRNVKSVFIRNRHASLSCTVTVLHSDGSNIPQVFSKLLAPGDELQYVDGNGFTYYPVTGTPTNVQIFTSAGVSTWSKPTTFTPVLITVRGYGGGGGGGGGASQTGAVVRTGGCGGR